MCAGFVESAPFQSLSALSFIKSNEGIGAIQLPSNLLFDVGLEYAGRDHNRVRPLPQSNGSKDRHASQMLAVILGVGIDKGLVVRPRQSARCQQVLRVGADSPNEDGPLALHYFIDDGANVILDLSRSLDV